MIYSRSLQSLSSLVRESARCETIQKESARLKEFASEGTIYHSRHRRFLRSWILSKIRTERKLDQHLETYHNALLSSLVKKVEGARDVTSPLMALGT